jgi:hypothetical protein
MLVVEIDHAGSYKGYHRDDGEPRNPMRHPNPSLTLSISSKPSRSAAGVEHEATVWDHPGVRGVDEELRHVELSILYQVIGKGRLQLTKSTDSLPAVIAGDVDIGVASVSIRAL